MSVFEPFMEPNMMALDFFHGEDFCFMRLIRRGAKNDFVMGSPIHCILYYNSVNNIKMVSSMLAVQRRSPT